ncbi:hypothetical protein KM043_007208 [Ampulex compressa]|nr:hypothetical protein KM043_007208 [Ampulex compressa]
MASIRGKESTEEFRKKEIQVVGRGVTRSIRRRRSPQNDVRRRYILSTPIRTRVRSPGKGHTEAPTFLPPGGILPERPHVPPSVLSGIAVASTGPFAKVTQV